MATQKVTQNHVSYVFSKEIILKSLLEKGIISDSDFDRYDQMLYDRYHMDTDLGLPRPVVQNNFDETLQDRSAANLARFTDIDYISLTTVAKEVKEKSPGYLVQSWLRDSKTLAFLRCWELKNNPLFDDIGYHELLKEMKSPSVTLTAKRWMDSTAGIGLQSKLGKRGGTFAHPEIAYAFKAWLNPDFQYALIQSYILMNSSQEHGVK